MALSVNRVDEKFPRQVRRQGRDAGVMDRSRVERLVGGAVIVVLTVAAAHSWGVRLGLWEAWL